jgi:flagellar motor component MotA
MSEEKKDNIEILFKIFLGAIAIIALKSIFENDNSKIISKKGKKMLSDSDKMSEFESKIKETEDLEKENSHNEIYL